MNHLIHNHYTVAKNRVRFFMGFGGKKGSSNLRPGALSAEEVKKIVNGFGMGHKVKVNRVDYDGQVSDSTPIMISSVHDDHFSGKIINVDRSLRERQSKNKVYVKGGGGNVDFFFDDGDIVSIEDDADNEIVSELDNTQALEILEALEVGDNILLSYFDKKTGGIINGIGVLTDKDFESKVFTAKLNRVNEIDQAKPMVVELDLHTDSVLDLQIL